MTKHYKVSYEVVTPYSDETLVQIIKVAGINYKLDYLPRPCNKISDLYCVYYKGVRFNTLAKFLKTINN